MVGEPRFPRERRKSGRPLRNARQAGRLDAATRGWRRLVRPPATTAR